MNKRIGFGVSAFLHLALLGTIVVSWPNSPAAEKEKVLPFSLSMLKTRPTVQPTKVLVEKSVQPTVEQAVEPIVEKPIEKVVEKKPTVEKLAQKIKSKPVKKIIKKQIAKKKPEKKKLAKPAKKITVKAKPIKKVRPQAKPMQEEVLVVSARPAQVLPVAVVDGARLLTIEDEFKQALLRVIEGKKYYPKRAKRRHREGVVKISFTVLRSGKLNAVRIYQSSGYKSLDQAALAAVAEISQFKPIPDALQRQQWDFVVPLRYELL